MKKVILMTALIFLCGCAPQEPMNVSVLRWGAAFCPGSCTKDLGPGYIWDGSVAPSITGWSCRCYKPCEAAK